MKKFVLFVMLMMSVASVSAQQRWSLTPEIGMTAVKRGGSYFMDEQERSWSTRWKIGVGVEFAVKPERFSLKSGLYYTQRGYSLQTFSFGSFYPTGDNPSEAMFNKVDIKLNRHLLQIPLMMNFSFRLADNVRLNLAAGPYAAWSVGDKISSNYMEYTQAGAGYGSTGSMPLYNGWNHDYPFDWGLSFQAGLEIGRCVISAGYDLSLGKEGKWDSASLQYQTFSLSVGYKFYLGK